MDLKKMQGISDIFIDKFKEAATKLVMAEVRDTDKENKETIIMFTARDMAIGARLKRNEYIAMGIGIGVVGTLLTYSISDMIINGKEETIYNVKKEDIDSVLNEMSATESETVEKESTDIEDDKKEDILEKVNDILKRPSNLNDLKAVVKELKDNEKK